MIKKVLPERFIPAPYPLVHSYKVKEKTNILTETLVPDFIDGVMFKFASLTLRQSIDMKPVDEKLKFIPFDYYCPSVHTQISRRVCKECQMYFASIKSLTAHKKCMHKRKKREIISRNITDSEFSEPEEFEHQDIEQENQEFGIDTTLPVIRNIEEWISNPWTSE